MIRAVIFDLDGTLLNTLDDIADSMNYVLTQLHFPSHSADSYRLFVGDGIRELARRVLPATNRSESLVTDVMLKMSRDYNQRWRNKTCVYPGIPEMLDRLVLSGLRLAIFSNKPDDFTQIMVRELLSSWKFDMVVGAGDRFPTKPSPVGAQFIADAMGIPPSEFLFLGDTSIDMLTALSAGMIPVGVTWGFRTRDELSTNGAQFLIDYPTDILTLCPMPVSRKGIEG